MKKLLGLAAGVSLAAFAAPSLAQAQNAYTTDYVNLRAGPGQEYPVVFEVPPSQPLQSFGCLSDWSWCDVAVGDYRGWMAGEFITYAYGGSYVPLYAYGPRYGVPIISFTFGSYWDRYYRDRPWYYDRDRWAHYDWRSRRWDDDRWRQWAATRQYERTRGTGDWRYQDDWRRQADHNRVRDNDGRSGTRDGNNWNGRTGTRDGTWDGRSGTRDGSWNRSDSDRRPGAPVRGTTSTQSSDPSVHSGDTSNHSDGNRFGNSQRWGNTSFRSGNGGSSDVIVTPPRSTDTDRVNRRNTNQVNTNPVNIQPGGDSGRRFERRDTNQVNTHVDQPRGNDRSNERVNRVHDTNTQTNNRVEPPRANDRATPKAQNNTETKKDRRDRDRNDNGG